MSEEREKRRRIVESVAHSSAMEGLPLSDDMKQMLYAVADGKMTSEEVREILLKKYGKKQE